MGVGVSSGASQVRSVAIRRLQTKAKTECRALQGMGTNCHQDNMSSCDMQGLRVFGWYHDIDVELQCKSHFSYYSRNLSK